MQEAGKQFRAFWNKKSKVAPSFLIYRTLLLCGYGIIVGLATIQYTFYWRALHLLRKQDKQLDEVETTADVNQLRKKLMAHARGDTLEVACGTVRNFKYLPDEVSSVTGVDTNEELDGFIKQKLKAFPKKAPFTFRLMAAEHLRWNDNNFDTVIDTFGLCTVTDPLRVLAEMRRVCKEEGKVLLLEHQIVPGKKSPKMDLITKDLTIKIM